MNTNTVDAKMLGRMFLSGAKNLEAKKEWINELNVFPVPDGDTGTKKVHGQPAGEFEHEAVHHELEQAHGEAGERQGDDRDKRLHQGVDEPEEQTHEGEAEPGVRGSEGLDAGDDERGDGDGDGRQEPIEEKAHGRPFG